MAALQIVPHMHSTIDCAVPATVPSQTASMTPLVRTISDTASPFAGIRFSITIASRQVNTGMDALRQQQCSQSASRLSAPAQQMDPAKAKSDVLVEGVPGSDCVLHTGSANIVKFVGCT